MSVPQSLLAILTLGPCYGYQLRSEFERRTGADQPLNVGQIYRTLERLERDGLVRRGTPDPQGHIYWRITDEGAAAVSAWFAAAEGRRRSGGGDVAAKVALATTLEGVDAERVIVVHREAAAEDLRRLESDLAEAERSGAIARALVIGARREAAVAEMRWLDRARDDLARHPDRALPLALATEKPRRGRPPRT